MADGPVDAKPLKKHRICFSERGLFPTRIAHGVSDYLFSSDAYSFGFRCVCLSLYRSISFGISLTAVIRFAFVALSFNISFLFFLLLHRPDDINRYNHH